MTDKTFWKEMDNLVENDFHTEQYLAFMDLLKKAYWEDLSILAAGNQRSGKLLDILHQAYLEFNGVKFLVCYTSMEHARRHKENNCTTEPAKDMEVATVRLRSVCDNMFNEDSIFGLIFNPEDEKMVVIIKDILAKTIFAGKL